MQTNRKIKVLAVVGPTASGKTSLSIELAKAFDGEIISADSMQIYKGMDIATAKPTIEEMQGIPHHLLDFLDADKTFSVASFIQLAGDAINDISSKNKLPIIAGGTGLYTDNLLNGIKFSEGETNLLLREELNKQFEDKGLDSLLEDLSYIDYDSYIRLKDGRNPKRIIRAIEVFKTTGITMTEQNRLSLSSDRPYDDTKIGLAFKDREKLYERINLRVDLMLNNGLIAEAEKFYSSNHSSTAVQAIGYKELKPYFDGNATLEECINSLKTATRRYAKRQLTWFKRDTSTHWFYVDDYNTASELYFEVISFLTSEGFDLK